MGGENLARCWLNGWLVVEILEIHGDLGDVLEAHVDGIQHRPHVARYLARLGADIALADDVLVLVEGDGSAQPGEVATAHHVAEMGVRQGTVEAGGGDLLAPGAATRRLAGNRFDRDERAADREVAHLDRRAARTGAAKSS